MFNANGEIELPRVVWFIIIGVAGGLIIMYGPTYLMAVILYVNPIAFIALFLTGVLILVGIDNAVDNRRRAEVRK
jgi:hypothetical protein